MITETEKRALQLAKKVFEHFTQDSLPIAREILALELDLGLTPLNGKHVNGVSIPKVKIQDGQQSTTTGNNLPTKESSSMDQEVADDPAQPVRRLQEDLAIKAEDDFPL